MTDYKYYAFISYKREDEKWAKWIQNQLESYRLPTKIREEYKYVPDKIHPVFRDKTDLSGGVLIDNIKSALESSKYLIVICSPKSARSEWVEAEIRAFVESGRRSRIIPLIVEGTPNSDDINECFNNALKSIQPELLGISVPELGRVQAVVKVVAQLLDLNFDDLWRREQRRQLKRKVVKYFLLFFVFFLIALIFYFDWPRREYYATVSEFGDGWGPRGIDKLTREEARHRNQYFLFIRTGKGKLQSVLVCNGAGRVTGRREVYVDPVQFGYPDYYREIYCYRKDGSPECVLSVGKEDVSAVDIKDGCFETLSGRAEHNGWPTEIRRFKLTRDDEGLVNRVEYMKFNGDDGVRAANHYGVYGEEREFDSLGRITGVCFIGSDGNVGACDCYGVYEIGYEYDEKGNLLHEQNYDKIGNLIGGENGVAMADYKYDIYGNVISGRLYDQNCNAAISSSGESGFDCSYDDKGNMIECLYLGKNFLPSDDYKVSLIRYKYNKHGFVTETSYYDKEGARGLNMSGYSTAKWEYNKMGKISSCEFFDENDERVLNFLGFAKAVNVYNKQGAIKEISYYGVDGLPCLENRGIARETCDDDVSTSTAMIRYYGTDGTPCHNKEGVSGIEIKYGDRFVILEATYLDTDGSPMPDAYGVQKVMYEYDSSGSLISATNFGPDGLLHNDSHGAATYKFIYDERGTSSEIEGRSADGKKVMAPPFEEIRIKLPTVFSTE